LLSWCSLSLGQEKNGFVFRTRQIRAVRAESPPRIDGRLDDPCWLKADWQDDFTQLKPSLGKSARVRTRVAVVFDRDHIYVAFRCLNPGPGAVYSRIMRRDGNMDLDNAVTLYLDTFHSRRDCYYFSTNSLGTQVDGRIAEDGHLNDKNWDCIWRVASREDSLGWSAEMAIPVNQLRFPKDSDRPWGINFRRNYPEFFEVSFWNPSDRRWKVSQFGDLVGLPRFKKRFTASLFPYLVNLHTNQPSAGRRHVYSSGGLEVLAGADLRFTVGTRATGSLTFNPDFATIEADQEVINLTRYETFYPEKRLYFLEGAELFRNTINVFYSRRIVDIDYGIKSSGRVGKANYALLSARERPNNGEPASQTSVIRLNHDIFGSSNIGFLTLDRSYSGGYNRVLSGNATIYLPSYYRFNSQFVASLPSGDKFTKAYFLQLARETDHYRYHLMYKDIQPGFRANVNTVGFIPDDDRRELNNAVNYIWWIRRKGIEHLTFYLNNDAFWSYKGTMRNLNLVQYVGLVFSNKLSVGFTNNYHDERFDKLYHNHTILPEIGYNEQEWNSYTLLYRTGRNFDSDLRMWIVRARFKLRDNFSLEYRFRHLRLRPDPDGRSTVQNVLTSDYNFTPNLYLRLFTQLNSRNDRFYIYGLLGWRFAPPFGALYVAYTSDSFTDLDGVSPPFPRYRQRVLFVKLTMPLTF